MSVFVGAGFCLLIAFIAYGLHQANALNNKIIVGLLIVIWGIGMAQIAYYYFMGYYFYHHGKIEQDCGTITYPNHPLTYRKRQNITTHRIATQSDTSDTKYRFRYNHEYYDNKLSFNGFKKGDKVCFSYIKVDKVVNGAPYWLKSIKIQSQ